MSEFGLESCFNTVSTDYNAVAMLDSTHVVVAYKDSGGDGYGCSRVGVINGNAITWGAENIFESAITSLIDVTALDSTHFVVAYSDAGNSNYGTAIVGLVSGTTISSYGSANVFNPGVTTYIAIDVLDSTHFFVAYKDGGNSNYGTAIVGVTDGGTTISSYGSENVFDSAIVYDINAATLDSTHFIIAYQDGGNSNYGTAIVGVTDGGTTISSYGSENVFNNAAIEYTAVTKLDATHFVIGYGDSGNSEHGTAIVGVTDGGTTISSYGSENVFNATTTTYNAIATLDSTHFIITYKDSGGAGYGCARKGTVSGTTISSYDTEQTFNSALTKYISVETLNATDYTLVYEDDGGADYGCGRVWGTPSGWSGTIMSVSNPAKVMGIAVADITSVAGIS
jgi:hypothetical protein